MQLDKWLELPKGLGKSMQEQNIECNLYEMARYKIKGVKITVDMLQVERKGNKFKVTLKEALK